MAVSEISPPVGDFLFYEPQIESIEYSSARKLDLILNQTDSNVELSLAKVKKISNLGARILSKTIYGRNVKLSGVSPKVEDSLQWATEYLCKNGDLDKWTS